MDLSLSDALAQDRLEDFIAQEEARGVGPAPVRKFEQLAEALVTAPPPEDQTSRSRGGDD